MNVYSGFAIPIFRRHVTVFLMVQSMLRDVCGLKGPKRFDQNKGVGGLQDTGVWELLLQVDRSHEDAIFWMFSATNTKPYRWIQSIRFWSWR
jgi:hypothetical protein